MMDPIDLLLTDVVLPQMDGRSLYGKLSEGRPEMKALFMSGHTDDFIVHHGVLDEGGLLSEKAFHVAGVGTKDPRGNRWFRLTSDPSHFVSRVSVDSNIERRRPMKALMGWPSQAEILS